ncbi:12699_t:CDS:2, partial [Entrophospora sp. SA101]
NPNNAHNNSSNFYHASASSSSSTPSPPPPPSSFQSTPIICYGGTIETRVSRFNLLNLKQELQSITSSSLLKRGKYYNLYNEIGGNIKDLEENMKEAKEIFIKKDKSTISSSPKQANLKRKKQSKNADDDSDSDDLYLPPGQKPKKNARSRSSTPIRSSSGVNNAKNKNRGGTYKVKERRQRVATEATSAPNDEPPVVKAKGQVPIKTFYDYLDPYFRDFTQEDLKFLSAKPNNQKYYEFPKLGKRYTETWEEELGELTQHDQGGIVQSNGKFNTYSSNARYGESDDEFFGSISERLLSSLIGYGDEFNQQEDHQYLHNGYHSTSGNNDIINDDDGDFTGLISKDFLRDFDTQDHNVNDNVFRELKALGCVDDDDEIGKELLELQARLRELEKKNAYRKSVLKESVKDMIGYQQFIQIETVINNEINEAYLARYPEKQKEIKSRRSGSRKTIPGDDDIANKLERHKELSRLIGDKWSNVEKFKVPTESIFNEEDMNNYVYEPDN